MLEEVRRTKSDYWGEMPSFGWLYGAFAALGIRPFPLERFYEFLRAHAGHPLWMWSDSDDPAGWPQKLREILDRKTDSGESRDAFEKLEAEQRRREATGEFVKATYMLSCTTCRVRHSASEPEVLRAMEPLPISEEAAAMFLARVDEEDEPYEYVWAQALFGVADVPSVEELVPFVRAHQSHHLVAALKPAAEN